MPYNSLKYTPSPYQCLLHLHRLLSDSCITIEPSQAAPISAGVGLSAKEILQGFTVQARVDFRLRCEVQHYKLGVLACVLIVRGDVGSRSTPPDGVFYLLGAHRDAVNRMVVVVTSPPHRETSRQKCHQMMGMRKKQGWVYSYSQRLSLSGWCLWCLWCLSLCGRS
jgi:hypothetical protein